jgi:hypothetical protein
VKAHAPSDVRAINLGDRGCGEQHLADEGQRLIVECPVCAPQLVATPGLGWAYNPNEVGLTCDERRQMEVDQGQAERAQALAMQVFGAQLANLTRSGALSPDPDTMASPTTSPRPSLSDLTDAELDAMTEQVLKAQAARRIVPEPENLEVTSTPFARGGVVPESPEPTEPTSETGPGAPVPPRRGRPRKTTK